MNIKNKLVIAAGFMFTILIAACSGQKIPDSPEGAAKAVLIGLSNNKPVIVWQAMPDSYQVDINSVVHDFANNFDPEIYNKGFSVSAKVADVLKEKKQFVINSPLLENLPRDAKYSKADIDKNWDIVLSLSSIILNSEISKIESLKALEVGEFLDETGSKIMSEAISASPENGIYFTSTNVELVSKDEGSAIVRLIPSKAACEQMKKPKCEPEEWKMKKVEGKWVPADLDWTALISKTKKNIASMNNQKLAKIKPKIMLILSTVDSAAEQISKSNTQEEFDLALKDVIKSNAGPLSNAWMEILLMSAS